MGKSLITLVNENTTNSSALKVGELRIPLLGTKGKDLKVNSSDSFVFVNNNVGGTINIVSDSNVTFTDGSTVLSTEGNNTITKNINSDKSFEISIINKKNIKNLLLNDEFNIDPNFDLTKLSYMIDLYTIEIDINFRSGNIDKLLMTSEKLTYIKTSSAAFNVKSIPKSIRSLVLTNDMNITGSIADLRDYQLGNDWAQVINQTSISGNLSDVPPTVAYINMPNTKVKWEKASRQNATFLAINSSRDSQMFASASDVDNMFIDQSTCTYIGNELTDNHGGAVSKITVNCNGSYNPSSDAQKAIKDIYSKGITSITVNNIQY